MIINWIWKYLNICQSFKYNFSFLSLGARVPIYTNISKYRDYYVYTFNWDFFIGNQILAKKIVCFKISIQKINN